MDNNAGAEIHLSGRLICADLTDVATIKAQLPEHIRLTLAEPGCLTFKVWQTDDPLIWGVEERFRNAEAFAHHQDRSRASQWWAATSSIARDYNISGLDHE